MKSTCNSAGRPNNKNAIKFSQQPRSTVSLLLLKERQNKFDMKESCISNTLPVTINPENVSTDEVIQNLEKPGKLCFVECHLDIGDKLKPLEEPISNLTNVSSEFNNILPSLEINHTQIFELNKNLVEGQISHGMKSIIVGGMKLFSCSYPQCTYNTNNSSNMSKHRRTHSQIKLYQCDQCTFSTKFSNSLNVHKRLHTQEKPFACHNCDYKCNSSSNLKKHLNHRHSTQYIQPTSSNKNI
ncbi:zinc finger protein 714-like [Pieris napi]|uniref:zinc finger protein 714-like n=1 Tax=Pieris napi TaxID=78633 RepID=UPI001FBA0FCF|nr:zinc finger protein 714-like [Pieris napi]